MGTNIKENLCKEHKDVFNVAYNVEEKVLEEQKASLIITSNVYNISKIINDILKQNSDFVLDYASYIYQVKKYVRYNYYIDAKNYIDSFSNEIAINGQADIVENLYLDLLQVSMVLIDYYDKIKTIKTIKEKLEILPKEYLKININKIFNEDSVKIICKYGEKLINIIDADLLELHNDELGSLLEDILTINTIPATALFKNFIFENLTLQEYHILQDRYVKKDGMTLQEIGNKYDITRERVRQIEKKSLLKFNNSKVNYAVEEIINQLNKISPYRYIIITSEIEDDDYVEAVKILNAAGKLNNNYFKNIYFYDKKIEEEIKKAFDILPTDIMEEDIYAYIITIQDNLSFSVSYEEIEHIFKNYYKQYGILWTNNKPKQDVIVPYLVSRFFPDGIVSSNEQEQSILVEKALELFDNFNLSNIGRALQGIIEKNCIQVGRGRYGIRKNVKISSDLMCNIIDYIEKYDSGTVPFQAVYEVFEEELKNIGINNNYLLHGKLNQNEMFNYETDRNYIIKNHDSNIYDKLESFVKNKGKVTKEEIQSNIDGITDIMLNSSTFNTGIVSMIDYYIHIDNLDITEYDKIIIKKILDEILLENKPINSKHIYEITKNKLTDFYNRIEITDYKQMFNVYRAMFKNEYSFRAPFIANRGVLILNTTEQIVEEIQQQGEINLNELREIRKRVGKNIGNLVEFIDELNNIIIFKNKNELITIEKAYSHDNFDNIDNVLKDFIEDNQYQALEKFNLYSKLPQLNIEWNEWVLYSIINKYSRNYYARMSSNILDESIPYLVSK